MSLNLQINRTLVKNDARMNTSHRTVSTEAMESEWEEIQAAQVNPTAFRPLYTRYYESIFRYIYKRTTDESLSADICSQVFMKAMKKIEGYSYQGVPFSAWLFRIASNEVAQHYRSSQKMRVVSVEDANLSNMMEEIQEEDAEDHRQILLTALEKLKPKDLEVIEMRFFEKRAFAEIARILDITESNAKVRTYRVLERLKKMILKKI
ncbi:MAG: RNA polymerase sigma-70 factor (ECF subfamily) [Paraglaciecola sp.]|jgi:RNA polymerase sigma-70 factor (ECF subfamily)